MRDWLLRLSSTATAEFATRIFVELHTAHLVTALGHRYLCGTGEAFLQHVLLLVRVCLGTERSLLLLADGARWIRTFFQERLAGLPQATMLLDWHHLEQKCRDLCSRICRTRMIKSQLLQRLYRRLWGGDVPAALQMLENHRPQAKNGEALDSLISYLQARVEWIPNYRQRRREQQYIGSGHGEKANDLLVARRQKRRGMQWSAATSTGLAMLSMLRLNGAWDLYWRQRVILPLVA